MVLFNQDGDTQKTPTSSISYLSCAASKHQQTTSDNTMPFYPNRAIACKIEKEAAFSWSWYASVTWEESVVAISKVLP